MHISIGTFKPVIHEVIEENKLDPERFTLTQENADKINQAKELDKRIIAVGTTSTRVMEYCWENGCVREKSGETGLFIYPGFKFNVVSGLITNFHIPKSTPFLLTSAFGGKNLIQKAYEYSINNDFRFYSYGDSMLIL